MGIARLIKALARLPTGLHQDPDDRVVLVALKVLAQRHQFLSTQIKDLEGELDPAHRPELLHTCSRSAA